MAKVEEGAKGGSLTVLSRKGKVGTFSYMDDDELGNYVYYRNLEQNPNKFAQHLGRQINSKLHDYISYANTGNKKNDGKSSSVIALRALAEQEREKEEAFLTFTFGSDYNLSFQSTLDRFKGQNFSNILTVLFNEKFAFEDDLRRLRKQLQHYGPDSQFTPNISRLFADYLHKAIVQYIREITKNLDIKKGVEQITQQVEKNWPQVVENGLRLMLNAAAIKGDGDKTYLHILKELEAQGPIQNSPLFNFLMKNYDISKHMAALKTLVKEMKQKKKINKDDDGYSFSKVWQINSALGGSITEYLENIATQELGRGLKGKGFKVSATHVGQHGKKADNDFIIWQGEMDEAQLQEILDKAYSTGNDYISNNKAIAGLDKILGQLSSIKEGYHLYISDKDYLLRSINDKDYRGMSAGDPITLGTYRKLTQSDDEFITVIMNTINGAYGDDLTEVVKSHIATDIANFAFDGVRINDSKSSGNVKAVHIFYLSGYYVPLSSMLFKLADAFESADVNKYKSYANIQLSKPANIMYPLEHPLIDGDYKKYTRGMWHEQAINALDTIKIEAFFMKSMREYIGELINV